MEKKEGHVKYECVSGYTYDEPGEYEIGDEIEGIGPVVNIIEDEDKEEVGR